ncbi:MAG: hypothetical protein IPL67_17770 [Ignavibacteria bacterium]|nr:hypothetical protein [Ignavibacteria bacterium]
MQNSEINVTTNDNLTEESFTENLVDYLPKDTLVLIDEPEITLNMVDEESLDKLSHYKQIGLTSFTNSMSDDSAIPSTFIQSRSPTFFQISVQSTMTFPGRSLKDMMFTYLLPIPIRQTE